MQAPTTPVTGAVYVHITGWIYVEERDAAENVKECAEDKALRLKGIEVDDVKVLEVQED